MIAYCGLLCDTCPIHLATLEPDKSKQVSLRSEIMKICHETYGMNLKYTDITDCDGCCANTGRIFSVCLACDIRTCARNKAMESCAECSDYPCNSLEKIFHDDPEAGERLNKLRCNR